MTNDLGKWFVAISLVLDARRGISAHHLAEQVGINKNTAWYLSRRIHKALLEASQRDLLLEIAEVNDPHMDGRTKNTRVLGVAL